SQNPSPSALADFIRASLKKGRVESRTAARPEKSRHPYAHGEARHVVGGITKPIQYVCLPEQVHILDGFYSAVSFSFMISRFA
ncbi:MAG: hypothetical protein ACI3XG_09790, partial [Faecousia sp.]